jgi:hypothetical protein
MSSPSHHPAIASASPKFTLATKAQRPLSPIEGLSRVCVAGGRVARRLTRAHKASTYPQEANSQVKAVRIRLVGETKGTSRKLVKPIHIIDLPAMDRVQTQRVSSSNSLKPRKVQPISEALAKDLDLESQCQTRGASILRHPSDVNANSEEGFSTQLASNRESIPRSATKGKSSVGGCPPKRR